MGNWKCFSCSVAFVGYRDCFLWLSRYVSLDQERREVVCISFGSDSPMIIEDGVGVSAVQDVAWGWTSCLMQAGPGCSVIL